MMNNNEESVLQQWVKGETLVVEGRFPHSVGEMSQSDKGVNSQSIKPSCGQSRTPASTIYLLSLCDKP